MSSILRFDQLLETMFTFRYQMLLAVSSKFRRLLAWLPILFFVVYGQVSIAQQLVIEGSHPQGFYTESIEFSLAVDHPGATIHYTLDGRLPSIEDPEFVNGIELSDRQGDPNIISLIPTNNIGPGNPYREDWRPPDGQVEKINVVRARAFLPDGTAGPVYSGTFIIDEEGSERYTMPLISLITDPVNLFGFEEGIYVPGITGGNYFRRGREWEREVYLTFFEHGGEVVLSQDAGVRIHGGTSRNRPRKTLRLYAREDYGNSWFDYAIFPDKPVSRYKRFLLRNSGNDWSESIFRDAFMQHLVKDNTSLDIQYSRPVIVFINGEYWGIHNIRDRFDDRYLQSHYDLEPVSISILEGNIELDDGNSAGINDYQQLMATVRSLDMTSDEALEMVGLMMDIDNYIDYQIVQIYCRNTDWPGNNIAYWKHMYVVPTPDTIHPKDGRWRWMVFDLDFGFGLGFDYVLNSGSAYGPNTATHNTLAFALEREGPQWPNPSWSTELFRSLMQNNSFKQRFISRFADHLNTTFSEHRVVSELDSFAQIYAIEIDEHIARWREPSRSFWESEVQTMRTFAELRERFNRVQINNVFDLGGFHQITLDVNAPNTGTIKVNSVLLSDKWSGVSKPIFPWTGDYFQTVPVQLIPVAEAGYVFSHWAGDVSSTSDTLILDLTDPVDITAYFEPDDTFEGDAMNPVPFDLSRGSYTFDSWSPDRLEGEFPEHMIFQQSNTSDPLLTTEMTDPYFIPYVDSDDNEYHANDQDKIGMVYQLTGRTRIEGLGQEGIALINTGRGRDLGAAVLALDTRSVESAKIRWTAQTLQANSRAYHIRLQYRVGLLGSWRDVVYDDGSPVDYARQADTSSETDFTNITFPEEALDQPYVQLRWKYYYTGIRLSEDSGQRDKIRLDDIVVETTAPTNITAEADFNRGFKIYPNPVGHTLTISAPVTTWSTVSAVNIYTMEGLLMTMIPFDDNSLKGDRFDCRIGHLPAGVYFVELQSTSGNISKPFIKH